MASVFDIVFYAAKSEVLLTRAAAEECLAALSGFLGDGILRGRVESTHYEQFRVNYSLRFVERYLTFSSL